MSVTIEDLVKEFERLAAMPNETFNTGKNGKVYFNSYVYEGDEPSEEETEKYNKMIEISGELSGMCNDLLITDRGGCNWANIHKLQAMGFRVYATDKDSFGWLCANVEKDNHIVSYG